MSETVCILFVGDVVGGIGKRALLALLPRLRDRYAPDFVVVNGENVAGGVGITPKIAREILTAGVDVITLGNHTYKHREVYPYLDEEERILRPANFLRSQPGHGTCVVERDGTRLGVVNLSGNLYMQAGRAAFPEADAALHELRDRADHVLVDMHAEATSEKVGMGWHLDGRVTAVGGTHTHVATAHRRCGAEPHPGELHELLGRVPAEVPPHGEGRVAVGLVGDRPRPEGVAVSAQEDRRHQRHGDGEPGGGVDERTPAEPAAVR